MTAPEQAPVTAAARDADPRTGWENRTVLVATAVIAVHVVDDNFVQPEPGMSAGDHLLSGLVPLAALAFAAAAYGRLRAGARAVVAICLGLFGITVSSEGWYYLILVGPSGDDYTGLAALPAGIVLLAVGVVTLWRSRRLDERWRRRYPRRAVIAFVAFVAVLEVVYPIVYAYGNTHLARAVVPAPDLGATHENVSFRTSDGLRLVGWYVPSRNRAAVISFPGRERPQEHARLLVRHGYGALVFDRRGEGESEGEPNSFGWGGDADLKAAVDFLADRPDVDPGRIGAIGFSVGGEMLLETAAEIPGLSAVVSEGAGIRSIRERLRAADATTWALLPMHALTTTGTALFSNTAPPPDLTELVGQIAPTPVFLIHAEHGQGGEELNPVYHDAAQEPKMIWRVPGSVHTEGILAQPARYEQRVVDFFDAALPAP